MDIDVFPILLPLVIVAIVFTFICFGHLAFKNSSIHKISMIMAVLSVPFSLFFFKILNMAVFELEISILSVHLSFLVLFFVLVFLSGFFKIKRMPSLLQIMGPVVTCVGAYLFLLA